MNVEEQGSKENHDSHQMPQIEEKVFTDEELTSLIDPILKMDDLSNDGYIGNQQSHPTHYYLTMQSYIPIYRFLNL